MSRFPPRPEDPEVVRFTLPFAIIRLNQWSRMHWSRRRKHMQLLQAEVQAALTAGWINTHSHDPVQHCEIRVDRYCNGTAVPDPDGLNASVKALLDTLVIPTQRNPFGLSVITNDTGDLIKLHPVQGHICRRGEQRTEVEITVYTRAPAPPPIAAVPQPRTAAATPRPPTAASSSSKARRRRGAFAGW